MNLPPKTSLMIKSRCSWIDCSDKSIAAERFKDGKSPANSSQLMKARFASKISRGLVVQPYLFYGDLGVVKLVVVWILLLRFFIEEGYDSALPSEISRLPWAEKPEFG